VSVAGPAGWKDLEVTTATTSAAMPLAVLGGELMTVSAATEIGKR
jgi:hypothetical protein